MRLNLVLRDAELSLVGEVVCKVDEPMPVEFPIRLWRVLKDSEAAISEGLLIP